MHKYHIIYTLDADYIALSSWSVQHREWTEHTRWMIPDSWLG